MADAANHLDVIASRGNGNFVRAASVEIVKRAGTRLFRHCADRGGGKVFRATVRDAYLGRDRPACGAVAQGAAYHPCGTVLGCSGPEHPDRCKETARTENRNRTKNFPA